MMARIFGIENEYWWHNTNNSKIKVGTELYLLVDGQKYDLGTSKKLEYVCKKASAQLSELGYATEWPYWRWLNSFQMRIKISKPADQSDIDKALQKIKALVNG